MYQIAHFPSILAIHSSKGQSKNTKLLGIGEILQAQFQIDFVQKTESIAVF